VFKVKGQAGKHALDRWLAWAQRCRIPVFAELGPKIRRHRVAIDAALEHGLSQGLIESTNTKVRVLHRIAFGFRSPEALIALAMLALGGAAPPCSEESQHEDPRTRQENEKSAQPVGWAARPAGSIVGQPGGSDGGATIDGHMSPVGESRRLSERNTAAAIVSRVDHLPPGAFSGTVAPYTPLGCLVQCHHRCVRAAPDSFQFTRRTCRRCQGHPRNGAEV
jgi:transposase